jgi:putative tricarboxylic transport membrane protein
MGVIGLMAARYISRLTNLKIGILAPMIATITVIGSFALGNNINDVWVMVIFGIMGYFMRKHGFHPAAMCIGLILGPMAENGFRQSVILAKGSVLGYFMSRPISVVLMVLILLTLFGPIVLAKLKARKSATARA